MRELPRKCTWYFSAVLVGMAALPLGAQNPAASLGKQRAVDSRLDWEIREAKHPLLGNIRFAFLKSPIETAIGNAKVYTRPYLSCQRASRKLAIELTNTMAPDDPGGLRPAADPRLVCSRLDSPADTRLVQEELLASWTVSEIGDALAQGFRSFPLRECVSIRVVQEVVLPAGSAQKSARVEFDLLPYERALDSIFATCGEVSAYPPSTASTSVAKAPKTAPIPPPRDAPPRDTTAAWQTVRVVSNGKTNVRAGPSLQSAVVMQLHPGSIVLVQRTGGEWWRIKARSGAPFEGYVREDRLVVK